MTIPDASLRLTNLRTGQLDVLGASLAISCRGLSIDASSLLPSAHAVGHPFVEVGRSYGCLYPSNSHPLSYAVTHTGEGEGDALALQLLDEDQQRIAGAGVDEIHRVCVQKNLLCRWPARGQRGLHPLVKVTDTGKEQIAK
jgi:hypothetical protein